MAVKVIVKECGGEIPGEYATIEGDRVTLFKSIKPDGNGGFRGSGRKVSFSLEDVEVVADRPQIELRYSSTPAPASWLRRLFLEWRGV